MKKPEKKKLNHDEVCETAYLSVGLKNVKALSYNESHDKWESFLPDVKKLEVLIYATLNNITDGLAKQTLKRGYYGSKTNRQSSFSNVWMTKNLAKAIAKRIGK